MQKSWSALFTLLAVLTSGCIGLGGPEPLYDFSASDPIPVVGEDAFYGVVDEVVEIDTDGWWTSESITGGGPNSDFLAGSAVLKLRDGTIVRIDEGTPSGNSCRALNPYEAGLDPVDAILGDDPCLVSGVFSDDGTAAWVAVVTGEAFRYEGQLTYALRLIGFQGADIAVHQSHLRGVPNLAFRIADDAEWRNCDDIELIEALGGEGIVASSQSLPGIVVTADTLQVIDISCI